MQKIDKTVVLSTVYQEWLNLLEQNQSSHGNYTSSQHRFYTDIAMALYHCQNGLCAYTERKLCEDGYFEAINWQDGSYSDTLPKTEGQLDHFDPTLKKEKAWLWDNFLMVLGKANNDKGEKPIDVILKPDAPNYEPFRLLDYDYDLDEFIPNLDLTDSEQKRVYTMIETLCLNAGYVKLYHKPFLKEIKANIELGRTISWADVREPKQFPTAFEMLRRVQLIR
jgi:hypothetical protein